ncbi:MAG: hypothetical protein AAGI25_19515 [Bacteroidota bacterium]
MKFICLSLFIGLFLTLKPGFSQSGVGIGITKPDPSTVLHVQPPENNKGMLIPRLTEEERNNIKKTDVSPANGLIIYNSTQKAFDYFDSTSTDCCWVRLIPTPAKFNIDMATNKIINLADGTEANDAVNKGQLDDVDEDNLDRDGNEAMTGDLPMGNYRITNMENGSASKDAVNKEQLDQEVQNLQTQIDDLAAQLGFLYVGSYFIGDIGELSSPNTSGDDEFVTVSFPSVETSSYIVLGSLEGESTDKNDDNDITYVVYDKTPTSFKMYFREYSNNGQNLRFRYMLIRSDHR